MAKRTLPLFYKIFFSVLVLAVCAVGVGLWMLNGVLEEYESVQPKNVADEIFAKYYASHDFDTLAAKCATENPFESAADVASYLHEKYDGAEMTCTSGAAQGEAPTYIVKVNDYKISSFTLKESAEKSKHGWVKYEEGDFVLYYDTAEVTVTAPETYKVFVNSVELGEAQVAQKDIPGEGDELLPQGVEGVKYTKYTVKGLIKTPEITSESPDGLASEVKYVESEKMYKVSPLFDDALMAEHKDYVLKAAEEYSKYMENDSWWGGISQYFDPSSEIYESARTSLTMFVIDHNGYRFDDVFVGEFYGYSDDVFSCRVSFTHVLTAGAQEYKDYFDSTIFFRRVDGTFKICGMINNA